MTLGEKVFGQPRDRNEAAAMLQNLSGQVHQVISGIALFPGSGAELCSLVVSSDVKLFGN